MKITHLLLAATLLLGAGISGNALADRDDHRRDHGWRDHGRHHGHEVYRYRHRDYGSRHWKKHRDWRPAYRVERYRDWRPRDRHDSWYGIHLFLGGH